MPYLKYTLLVIFALGSLLKVSAHAPAGDTTTASRSTKKPRFEIQVNGIYATLETNLRLILRITWAWINTGYCPCSMPGLT
jgi:hypothetical protein